MALSEANVSENRTVLLHVSRIDEFVTSTCNLLQISARFDADCARQIADQPLGLQSSGGNGNCGPAGPESRRNSVLRKGEVVRSGSVADH